MIKAHNMYWFHALILPAFAGVILVSLWGIAASQNNHRSYYPPLDPNLIHQILAQANLHASAANVE